MSILSWVGRKLFGSPSEDMRAAGEIAAKGFVDGLATPVRPDMTIDEFLDEQRGTAEIARRARRATIVFGEDE